MNDLLDVCKESVAPVQAIGNTGDNGAEVWSVASARSSNSGTDLGPSQTAKAWTERKAGSVETKFHRSGAFRGVSSSKYA